jgi:hypothetical protein
MTDGPSFLHLQRDRTIYQRDVRVPRDHVGKLSGHKQEVYIYIYIYIYTCHLSFDWTRCIITKYGMLRLSMGFYIRFAGFVGLLMTSNLLQVETIIR